MQMDDTGVEWFAGARFGNFINCFLAKTMQEISQIRFFQCKSSSEPKPGFDATKIPVLTPRTFL